MNNARIFFIILSICLAIYIFRSIRRNKLSLEQSILWSVASIIIFVLGSCPNLIIRISALVGIEYAPSLLFLIAIIFLIVLGFNISMTISELKEKNKELIQNSALLDERIRELEKERKNRC